MNKLLDIIETCDDDDTVFQALEDAVKNDPESILALVNHHGFTSAKFRQIINSLQPSQAFIDARQSKH